MLYKKQPDFIPRLPITLSAGTTPDKLDGTIRPECVEKLSRFYLDILPEKEFHFYYI